MNLIFLRQQMIFHPFTDFGSKVPPDSHHIIPKKGASVLPFFCPREAYSEEGFAAMGACSLKATYKPFLISIATSG
jgi:hypothetical protein